MDIKNSNGPFTVAIHTMLETHQVTYWVNLTNTLRPETPSFFDNKGKISPYISEVFENAYLEAKTWAKFLGTEVTPYVKPDWLDAKLVELGKAPLTDIAPDVDWMLEDD